MSFLTALSMKQSFLIVSILSWLPVTFSGWQKPPIAFVFTFVAFLSTLTWSLNACMFQCEGSCISHYHCLECKEGKCTPLMNK